MSSFKDFFARFVSLITKEPTLFSDPENVDVSYDATTRKVTLGGTVNAYYRGVPFPDVFSGYVSPAHDSAFGVYFLIYDGTSINWKDPSDAKFSDLLIAYAIYQSGYKIALREPHGSMPWPTHEELHNTLGTYKASGGIIGDYTLNSATEANRRPSVSQADIRDEDLPTINLALAANGSYTQMNLFSTETAVFDTVALDIVPLSTNRPYFNELSGGNYSQTLMDNNRYMSIWLIAVPTTSDSESQKYRFVWLQGQSQSSSLATEETLTTNDINLGELENLSPESVFIGRIIIRYQGGNWTFIKVEEITGTRVSQSQGSSGVVQNEYTDDLFRILDNDDPTKKIAFEASGVTTGTTRTLTAPDKSGIISLSEIVITPKSTGTTAILSHNYTTLEFANGINNWVYVIPLNSSVAFPIGSWIEVRKTGTGELVFIVITGVTVRGPSGAVPYELIGADGYSAFLEKTDTDEWLFSGSIADFT